MLNRFLEKNLDGQETFFAGGHLILQNHFEDTPREAVRVFALTASLLLGLFFHGIHLAVRFVTGFWETLQRRLFVGKFRQDLVKLRNF